MIDFNAIADEARRQCLRHLPRDLTPDARTMVVATVERAVGRTCGALRVAMGADGDVTVTARVGAVEAVVTPGPDGTFGTADDEVKLGKPKKARRPRKSRKTDAGEDPATS